MVDRYLLGRRGTNTGSLATSLVDDANLGGPDAARDIDRGCQVLIDAGTRAGDITQLAAKPNVTTGLAAVDPNFGGVLAADSTYIILDRPLRFVGGGFALLYLAGTLVVAVAATWLGIRLARATAGIPYRSAR